MLRFKWVAMYHLHLLLPGAISGQGGGALTATLFFLLGQFSLVVMTMVYNFITPYDLHEELEKDNVAAGVAFSGTLVSVGIILLAALSGNFRGWSENLYDFGIDAAVAFLVLPIFEFYLIRL